MHVYTNIMYVLKLNCTYIFVNSEYCHHGLLFNPNSFSNTSLAL